MKQRTELWVTTDILKQLSNGIKHFMILRNTKQKKRFSSFKMLRNKAQNLILNAKRNYFKDKLESEKTLNHYGSLSRTWVCCLKKGKSSSGNISLKIDGELSFDN